MRAIDTNVLVRHLTDDEPSQSARARAAIDEGDIFVSTTVLLESEWVLCSAYGFSGQQVAAGLRGLAGLPTVTVENPTLLIEALERVGNGMDFADALHLGPAAGCEALLTFHRRFIETAKGGPLRVLEP